MISANQTSASDVPAEISDQVDEAALAEVMRVVPLGAGVVAGTAVALLVPWLPGDLPARLPSTRTGGVALDGAGREPQVG
jgi:hypothetical protein